MKQDPRQPAIDELKRLSPPEPRGRHLVDQLVSDASVPIRYGEDQHTRRNLAYRSLLGKPGIKISPKLRSIPGVLAHELGHHDATSPEASLLDRGSHNPWVRGGAMAAAMLGGSLVTGLAPKTWQKALGGAAAVALGSAPVLYAEHAAGRNGGRRYRAAGATEEEMKQYEDQSRFARASYYATVPTILAMGPLYGAVMSHILKGASLYTVKQAWHAHDRMEERTSFHRDTVDDIQKAVDLMGLKPGSYHLPLRDKNGNIAGYAVFKGVPDRKTPVLSTVFHRYARPPGQDIEAMLKSSAAFVATGQKTQRDDLFDTFGGMTPVDDVAGLPTVME